MDRKEMIKILGEYLGVKPRYLGAPSFHYQIETPKETYIIDREGRIMTSDGTEVEFEELLAGPEDINQAETAEPEEEINYELEIPMDGHSGKTLRNIINIIHSKQPLIKKSLGLEEDLVDSDFVKKLNEEDINSIDSFERALNRIGGDKGHPGIKFNFKEKTFTFKHNGTESAIWLFAGINKQAKRQSYASAIVSPMENEKYTFRSWLNRLGLSGDEYKEIRKELLKNLSGNCAFRIPKEKVKRHEA
ncbi:virulence-related protein [Clostridium cochlearium]|uniref:virulence-related protein n=1 Tax=Clostridium cochlearium TaxID=1494 RepID=UPI000B94EC58|nr:virulence-related protein [Clostridium cochlearium]SNV67263.1 virulence-like protein [Clostridium cochlearium]STA91615.1 virulence-like protein [Clostridium cochlearium]